MGNSPVSLVYSQYPLLDFTRLILRVLFDAFLWSPCREAGVYLLGMKGVHGEMGLGDTERAWPRT